MPVPRTRLLCEDDARHRHGVLRHGLRAGPHLPRPGCPRPAARRSRAPSTTTWRACWRRCSASTGARPGSRASASRRATCRGRSALWARQWRGGEGRGDPGHGPAGRLAAGTASPPERTRGDRARRLPPRQPRPPSDRAARRRASSTGSWRRSGIRSPTSRTRAPPTTSTRGRTAPPAWPASTRPAPGCRTRRPSSPGTAASPGAPRPRGSACSSSSRCSGWRPSWPASGDGRWMATPPIRGQPATGIATGGSPNGPTSSRALSTRTREVVAAACVAAQHGRCDLANHTSGPCDDHCLTSIVLVSDRRC